jgi:hypothetical protein
VNYNGEDLLAGPEGAAYLLEERILLGFGVILIEICCGDKVVFLSLL